MAKTVLDRIVKNANLWHIIFAVGFILSLLFLVGSATMKTLFICSLFIFMSVVIRFYKRVFFYLPVEIELITFTITLLVMAFGFWYGLITGLIGFIASEIVHDNINQYIPITAGFYVLVAMLVAVLPGDVVTAGIIVTLLNNAAQFTLYYFVGGFSLFENISYSITSILFNLFIFIKLGAAIMSVLG